MKALLAAAVLAMAVVSSPASAAGKCLQIGRVYSWHAEDGQTVLARDDLHRYFKVTLSGPCPNLKNNIAIALRAHANSALDCVRRGDSLAVKAFGGTISCPIEKVEPAEPPKNAPAPAGSHN
jgi:hypothetical protein